MMQRDWREQCEELAKEPAPDLPEGRFNLVVPRSRCPSCGAAIKAWQNIPVLSYLLLGAQCASCRASISVRYPLVEILTAVLAAICAWRFGFGWEALMAIGMTCALVAISLIDADTQYIFDVIVVPLLWVGLIMSLFHPLAGSETLFIAPKDAIIGAVAGYLSLWSVYQLYKLGTGKEGFGYGDFKQRVFDAYWEHFAPVREKREQLENNLDYVHEVMARGAEKAREESARVLDRVRKAVGLR